MRFQNFLKDQTPQIASYDKTKINLFGNVRSRSIDAATVYGPALTRFIDINTDFASAQGVGGPEHATVNGRKFTMATFTAGVVSIALYTFNYVTGAYAPVGRLLVTLPNQGTSAHTARFIRVIDNGTTGWTIFIGTVATTTVLNGGVFRVNKIDLADFQMGTPNQIYMAVADDAKAVYMLQDPAAVGVAHAMTTIMGAGLDPATGHLITTKGSAATLSTDGFDTAVAPTIVQKTTTGATVNASPTFQMTAHGYANNDPVVILSNAPTGFTATLANAIQTVYFVRNATANTFELSATSGGASINATSATSNTVFARAFGTTTTAYLASRKSGTVTTGFVGTALLTDAQKIVTPGHGGVAGVKCLFFPTTSNFYFIPLTAISAGVTSFVGSVGVNNSGTGTDYTGITNVTANYSEALDKIVYSSAAFGFFMKSIVNSQISHAFGTQIGLWLENTGRQADYFRGFVVVGLEIQSGWLFVTINTAGQRGILAMDARSDQSFNYSYLITPVQDFGGPSKARFASTVEKLYELTDTVHVFYRTANTEGDALFSSETGGWVEVDAATDLSTINLLRYVQLKITWDLLTFLSGVPTQLEDIGIGYDLLFEMDPYWKGLATGTTATSPSHTVYRQTRLYASYPSSFTHFGFDDDGNTVEQYNTTTHASQFTHSLDEGVTWLAGLGPNQVGKRLRFTRVNPPSLIVTNALKAG